MEDTSEKTFWEHLDDLRGTIVKILVATFASAILLFLCKEELFNIVLAPKNSDFISYRLLNDLLQTLHFEVEDTGFSVNLINTQLASQFTLHIKVAFILGLMVVLPYILYQLFLFIAPALYQHEKKYVRGIVVGGYFQFIIGTLLSYFVIFPLTFRFLGTYQVSEEVANIINLESYIDTFFMLNMMMGIVFEIPVISWLLAKLGVLTSRFMSQYRRHAIVATLILSAIITPTGDAFTLALVALPIYILYEISIWVIKWSEK